MTKKLFSLKSIVFYCSLLLFPFVFNSCHLFEPPSDIPSYIHIDSIGFTSDPFTQGSNSHKITDAWVYVDQNLLGVYELPATFPVLASGTHEIDIKAGIMIDGIASSRGTYPFYTIYTQNVNLIKDNIDTIKPIVTYYPVTNFTWMENFENASISLSVPPDYKNSDTLVAINSSQGAFEGNFSEELYLLNSSSAFMCTSDTFFSLPTDGRIVYLEMNYKTENTIGVGVVPIGLSTFFNPDTVLQIKPSASWNKIYVDLTSVVGVYPNAIGFKIFFGGYLDPGVINPHIYFDNLKLIHQ
jgi:hypothetical protein